MNRKGVRKQTGTQYLVADNPFGTFKYINNDFLCGDEIGSFYSGKVIQDPADEWVFLACRQFGPDHTFIGEITDPIQVNVQENGQLSLSNIEKKLLTEY